LLLKPHGSLNWRKRAPSRTPITTKVSASGLIESVPGTGILESDFVNKLRGLDPMRGIEIEVRPLGEIGETAYHRPIAIEFANFADEVTGSIKPEFQFPLDMLGGVGIFTGTYIVPPSTRKFSSAEIPDQLSWTWRHVNEALSNCKFLTIIGSSFRANDIEFFSLLRLAILRRAAKPLITVVAPDADEVARRLERILPACRIDRVSATLETYVSSLP